jgi:chromosome segregation ATPase
MKTNKIILNLFLLAAAVAFATGCASTGNDKSASTVKSLAKSSKLIEKGNQQIDQTLAKLNDLISNPAADLQKQFAAFDSSVNDLGSTAKSVSNKAEQIKAQGADYFENWDKESAKMNNEDIRHRSQARKQEVAANFDRISKQYDETKAAFQPFMSDLRDIQGYLNTDLTAGGLVAIKSSAAKATSDAIPLKESIRSLDEAFKGLKVSMSTASGVVQ